MAVRNNFDDNKLITGTSSADSIVNGYRYYDSTDSSHHYSGLKATIDGGNGNDSIYNGVNEVSINGGTGNDYIDNRFGFILFGLSTRYASGYVPTSDQISKPDNSKLIGGDGNDTISNNGANVTITGGAGADSIVNGSRYEVYPASKVKINGGAGNDSIYNGAESYNDKNHQYSGDTVTIDGGDGDDYIQTRDGGEYSSIIGGKGNDSILNGSDNTAGHAAKYLTISGGAGNDSVFNNGENVTIDGGTGDDTVYNWSGNNSSILGGAGNDSIDNWGGSSVSIDAGTGNDSIVSRSNNDTLNGGAGNDLISLVSSNHLIQYASGDGNDTIYSFNETDTLTISGGSYSTATSGNDVIVTVGKGKVLLVGANGKTLNINKTGTTKLITLTDNDDEFYNNLSGIKINGKDGNDTIVNHCFWNSEVQDAEYYDKVTIDGGKGNDSILSEGGNKFSINGGDGDDTIEIEEGNNGKIYGGAGNDYISNEYGKNFTVYGGEGNDYISGGKYVDAGDGDDTISLSSYAYNNLIVCRAGDGDDKIYGFNSSSTLSITGGYSSTKSGSDVIVSVGDEKITLVGAASLSSVKIVNEYNPLLVVGTKSNDSISQNLAGATVKALDGNDFIDNCGAKVSLFGGAGNDTITNKTSYTEEKTRKVTKTIPVPVPVYENVDETITASEMVGRIDKEIKEINASINSYMEDANKYYEWAKDGLTEWWNGQGDDATLAADNLRTGILKNKQDERKKYAALDADSTVKTGETIQKQTGWTKKDSIVTSTETYSVTHQTNNKGTTIYGGTGDDYVINEAADFVYSYTVGEGNDTISGFNAASKLSISGGSYTASTSGNDIILKVGKGSITLKDTKGMILNINGTKTFKPAWTLKKTTATYGSAVETLATVKGVKSLDGLSLKNKVVTVSDASLNKSKVTVSNGYTLKLGKDVTKPSTTKAWSLNKSTATYKQTTTAGYTLTDNAINYSKKAVETLATVKGVKSLDGLSLKNKVVTVSDASLNKSKVTVSNGYTLKLGKDVTKPSTTKAWSLNKSTATYKQTTTAGYTLADNAINYSKKSVETLATVKGVKSLDGLSLKNKVVTVSAAALNKKKVTVSDGYTLKLGKDVTKPATSKAWSLNKSTATYKQTTTAGYTLTDNAINYSKKSVETLATIKGVTSTDGLKVSGKKITLKNSSLKSKVTIGGGYEFDFAKDYTQSTISGSSGNDTITIRGKKISINAGDGNDSIKILGSATTVAGGKGNDSLWGSSYADNFIYSSGDGKDVIYGFDDKDTLTLDGLDFKASCKSDAITFKVDGGSITLKDFSATSFNVNGSVYKIKGTNLVKK